MMVDISERKRAEEHQEMLVRELHHRVKNMLATVQAIMGSTARSAETIEEFKEAMIGRIGSLARTHLLLSEEGAKVSFADILHNELDAFDDGSEGRIRLEGPDIEIASRLAVSLGMAIHELTTNAAKYGALSVFGGRLDVTWRVTIEAAARRTLEFDWVESSGPPVSPPGRQGFGSRLLDFVLPGQIQARSQIDYRPQGVHVQCTLPLPAGARRVDPARSFPRKRESSNNSDADFCCPWVPAFAGTTVEGYIALTMLSVIFLASPSSIMVLSR